MSNYTYGSMAVDPSARCRNTYLPISLNETTRRYIEDFAGPDIIHVYLNGPEKYVTDQQINLGNCTYAIPYVLSRPGQFWVTRIVHAYQDYQSLNENFGFIPGFVPKYLDFDILPTIPPTPNINSRNNAPAIWEQKWEQYRAAVSKAYSFIVCEGCPQF
ncbi:hypothetical protein BGZ76_007778, partial [Entomortierella beljakovae]